jgi:hypothetical protein
MRQHGYRIDRATARRNLRPRAEPYWQGLGPSRALGLRRALFDSRALVVRVVEALARRRSGCAFIRDDAIVDCGTVDISAQERSCTIVFGDFFIAFQQITRNDGADLVARRSG